MKNKNIKTPNPLILRTDILIMNCPFTNLFGKWLPSMYPPELMINESTKHLEFDNSDHLSSKIYSKRDLNFLYCKFSLPL